MKQIKHILIFTIISISAISCTRNNGNIGDYFGTWKLEQIFINNEKDTEYNENIFWGFQSSVFMMKEVNDTLHTKSEHWGTWDEQNGKLILNFTHSDNNNPQGSFKYSPAKATYLPVNSISVLDIITLSGNEMKLQYTDSIGNIYKYNLTKW